MREPPCLAGLGPLFIRDAEPRDYGALAALVNSLGYPSSEEQIKVRLSAMAPGLYRTFLADLEGRVAGMIGVLSLPVYTCNEPIGWILALVVDPDLRGRGIGRQLLRHAEQHLAIRGVNAVQLYSGLANDRAHRFYGTQGYGPDAIRFLKSLAGVCDGVAEEHRRGPADGAQPPRR